MTKEEYKQFLDDTETSLAVIKASKGNFTVTEALLMLQLGLEIAKEKILLDNE